jgi:hypothetical protein
MGWEGKMLSVSASMNKTRKQSNGLVRVCSKLEQGSMYSSDITYIYISTELSSEEEELERGCGLWRCMQHAAGVAVLNHGGTSWAPGSASMQYNRQWHEKAGDTGQQGFAQQP